MGTGSLTSHLDVAQVVLYVFWGFFAGLIYYLHRENKREGYPLESDRSGHVDVQGFPAVPSPKAFHLRDGRTVFAPNIRREERDLAAEPSGAWLGAPLEPIGDPMQAGVGPGAWALRRDEPDTTVEGLPRVVPLRAAEGFSVSTHDTDPIGLPVMGADGAIGGTVVDAWVDRAEYLFRYLEVQLPTGRRVLLPMNFARVKPGVVQVRSILGAQFEGVPATRDPGQVTLLEEDRVMAYYGGGTLYATPQRQEPLL